MAKQTIIKENPVISVISLSRYITAENNKKEKILKKLKFSEAMLYARYSSPRSAINEYLKDKDKRIEVFDEFIQKEKARVVDNSYKVNDQKCSLECLDILKVNSPLFFAPFKNNFSKRRLKKQFTHIYTYGVDVSLSPDYAIYDLESKKLKGFVKLNFSKKPKDRLTYQQGQLITGLIKEHLEEQFDTTFDRKMCIALDIYASKVIVAPEERTWIKDRPKLDNAYNEISRVWPFIQK
ncbi:MAG: hypothetical protein JWQ63_1948 [Mucilaginibacter sp.]|nr:hypothetical protein [Mucilaginibacter sp.]